MKKYKVHFSFLNLLQESQAEVVKLQTIIKGILGAGVVTTWAASNSTYAIIFALGAGLLDMLIACFYFEELKPQQDVESNSYVN